MKNRNTVIPISIIGLIAAAFTLTAFFLLEIPKTPVNIWALVFLLFSETVLVLGIIMLRFSKARYSGAFLKAGITIVLTLYFFAALLCVFMAGGFSERLNTFILLELAVIAVTAVLIIAVLAYSGILERRYTEDSKKSGDHTPKRGGF